MRRNSLLFLFSLLTTTCFAQIDKVVQLKANDKSIRYDLVKPGHYLKKLINLDSAGNVTDESVFESFTRVDSQRKEILFINTFQFAPGDFLVDSSLNNYSGSVSYVLYMSTRPKHQSVVYHPTSVVAHSVVKGVVYDKTTPMEEGYFDDNSISDVLPYIPFQKGLIYRFNCYGTDFHTQDQEPYSVEYVLDDFQQDPKGNMANCEVLHLTFNDVSSYFWIDKETHRTLKLTWHGKNYSFVELAL
jgi:hypothetical protein